MSRTTFSRIVLVVPLLLPIATACGGSVRSVGERDAGADSSTESGKADAPGHCTVPVVNEPCTQSEIPCATAPIPMSSCDICDAAQSCIEEQGWSCEPGVDVWGFSGALRCVSPDAGTPDAATQCEGTNPGCCGLNQEGCYSIIAKASCSGSEWACSASESIGPACPKVCTGTSDAGSGAQANCLCESTEGCVNQPCTTDAECPAGEQCGAGVGTPGDVCSVSCLGGEACPVGTQCMNFLP